MCKGITGAGGEGIDDPGRDVLPQVGVHVALRGYLRLGTYIMSSEGGASLRASGWRLIGSVTARSWDAPSRPRVDRHQIAQRELWEVAREPR